jgi:hypothetical protein
MLLEAIYFNNVSLQKVHNRNNAIFFLKIIPFQSE